MGNRYLDFSKCKTVYEVSSFNLGHILQGILWEISFHGDPDRTEQMSEWLDTLSNDSELGSMAYRIDAVMFEFS